MIRRIGGKRLKRAAAVLLVLLVIPGTWWRTTVTRGDVDDLRLIAVHDFYDDTQGDFQVTGVWQVVSDDLMFGGYSALLLEDGGRMLTFSDRGRKLSFSGPDAPPGEATIADQRPDAGMEQRLWDIESATRDPATGTFWLGYEGEHGVQRYTADGQPDGHVLLPDFGWDQNGGAESMVRLADGRFVLLPESESQMYFFAGDPVAGGEPTTIPVEWPESGYSPTDAAQLPDGRLLVLMRRVVVDLPPTFDSILVVGDLPAEGETWQPDLALTLHDTVPRDNYEGMAVRPLQDGRAEVWLISDDNFSAFQRTLLVRIAMAPAEPEGAQQKAREDRSPRAFSRASAG